MRNRLVRTAVLAALSSAGALSAPYVLGGDIVFDGSLPGTTAGALNAVNGNYAITQNRGFLNGSNLFHSFDVFNLDQGETAVFSGNAAIANIISRVTGGIPTLIDGTIRSSIDGANFWMVNPAGLTVGPNGAIDVSGAIALGAADSIDFANGQRFFALPDGDDMAVSLLVSSPVDFGFLENSIAGELVIQNGDFLARSTLVAEQRQIQPLASNPTLDRFSVLLSGGAGVFLQSQGDLRLEDARVRTGSGSFVGPIDLLAVGSIDIRNSDLLTSMDVGSTGGDIFIQGGELVTISRSSLVTQSIAAGVPTGDIAIAGAGVLISEQSLIAANFKARPNPAPVPTDPDEEFDPDEEIDPQEGVGAASISILTTGRSAEAAPHLQLSTATSGVVRIVDSAVLVRNAGGKNFPGGGGVRIGRTDQYSFDEPEPDELIEDPDDPEVTDSPALEDAEDRFGNVFGADHVVIAGSVIATDATDDGAADDIQLGGRQSVSIISSSTGGYRDGGTRLDANSTISARASNTALGSGQISILAGAGVSIDQGTLDTTNAVPGDEQFIFERRFDFDDVFDFDIEIAALGHVALEHATLRTDSTGIKNAGDIGITAGTVRINGGQLTTSVNSLRPRDQPAGFDYAAGDIDIFAGSSSGQPALVIENGALLRTDSTNNGDPFTDPEGAAAGSISLSSPRGTIQVSDARLQSASDGLNGGSAGQIRMDALAIDITDATISVAALSQNPNAFTGLQDIGAIELFADEGALRIARSQLTASSTAVGVAGDIAAFGTSVDIVDSKLETSSAGKGATGNIDVVATGRDFGSTDVPLRIVNSSLTSASVGMPTTIGGTIIVQTSSGGIELDRATFNSSVASDGTGSQLPFGGLLVEARISISAGPGGTLQVTDSSLQTTTSSPINGGDISLGADAIVLRGSTLSASSDAPMIFPPTTDPVFTPQRGNAGSISIQATGPTFGFGGFGLPWPDMTEAPPAGPLLIESTSITTNATANRGGDISIGAGGGLLRLSDATLLASAGGMGAGGNIAISDVGGVTLQGTDVLALAESGTAGTVSIELGEGASAALLIQSSRVATNATNSAGGSITLDAAGNQVVLESSSIVASAGGAGIGGDIRIDNAAGVTLQDSQVQALANAGTGGTIAIALVEGANGPLQINNTQIATSATAANGGDISFEAAGHQVLVRGSSIVASAGGSGTGGGIAILNAAGATVQDSQFQALANAGSGGTIRLTLAPEARSEGPLGPMVFDNSTITTNATSADGGSISLDAAGRQVLMRGSAIVASAGGNGRGGDISILNAGGATLQASQIQALANAGAGGTISIDLTDGVTGPVVLDGSSITTNATAADGGSISLDAAGNQVVMRNSSVVASAGGAGMGGGISILNAGGATLLDSQIQALANAGGGGTISIDMAEGVTAAMVFDNSSITANAAAADGGSISLDAAGNQVVMRNSAIVASAGGSGVGGDISIANAGGAMLQDSQIQALADAGDGGTIGIHLAAGVTGSVVFDNASITTNAAAANGGNISLDAAGKQVVMRDSAIVASAGGSGIGGDISIVNAGGATLQNSQIQALADAGAGGTIKLALATGAAPLVIQNSAITTNATAAGGGDISIDAAGNPVVMRDSTIRASAGAAGAGGNILIDNAERTFLQRSQILARADAGNGGTITLNLNTGALFIRDAQSTLSADSNSGNDGAIDINSPDTDLNPAVKPQEIAIGSAPELSSNACVPVAAAARSTFVRENRGGVSTSPDGYLASVDSTASASQKTASAATREAIRVAMADANVSATGGCR